jgi:hypothetical protein
VVGSLAAGAFVLAQVLLAGLGVFTYPGGAAGDPWPSLMPSGKFGANAAWLPDAHH